MTASVGRGGVCTVVPDAQPTCRSCGTVLPPRAKKGIPRQFCDAACRSRAYVDRREADLREVLRLAEAVQAAFDELGRLVRPRTVRKRVSRRG